VDKTNLRDRNRVFGGETWHSLILLFFAL
jgi:hypothetical protein